MSDLAPQKINLSFGGLLQIPGGLTSSLQYVTDGNGVNSGVQLSTTGFSGTIVSDAVTITGGTINGTAIGATNPSTGRFSTLTAGSLSGILKGTSGLVSAATSGVDYAPATSGTSILKGNGSGGFSSAVANTDYQSVISATGLLKGAGSGSISGATVGVDYSAGTSALATGILKSTTSTGALSIAVSGTDYAPATSGTSILKGNGAGGFSNASSGTDYAPATSGTSILYGNGSGGFSNVTVGSGLQFSGGTLASTSAGGSVTTVSVVSANGFAGTVANASSTPAITLSTSVTGVLKGNGTAISAATAGTDYTSPTGTENLSNKTITSSSLNSTPIGASSASTGAFTDLSYTGTLTGSTGVLNIGSGQIYKDASGNVGIGTTSPGYKLQANGLIGSYAATPGFVANVSGTQAGYLYSDAGSTNLSELRAFPLIFSTNSSEKMRLTSAGYLGIGTSSPSYLLDVAGTVRATNEVTISRSDTTNLLTFQTAGTSKYTEYLVSGGLRWYSYSTSSDAMTLDASGNLGLGVTPSAWSSFLAVQIGSGALASTGVGNHNVSVAANAYYSASGWKYIGTNYATEYRQNSGEHQWAIAPSGTAGNAISWTQAMKLDASGNLLVGTTTASTTPVQGVSVYGSASSSVIGVGHASGSASGNGYILFAYNGTLIGSITQNGTTGVLYNITSDQRLKTNVTPAGSAIQSILDFPVDQFDWIADGSHQDFGAVAQKVLPIIPEMVSVPADSDEMMGIDWSKANPRLIKAFQELEARVRQLEATLH